MSIGFHNHVRAAAARDGVAVRVTIEGGDEQSMTAGCECSILAGRVSASVQVGALGRAVTAHEYTQDRAIGRARTLVIDRDRS